MKKTAALLLAAILLVSCDHASRFEVHPDNGNVADRDPRYDDGKAK